VLDPSHTIAVALQDAGYHTIMAGNYLNKVRGSRVPPGWDRTFIKRFNQPPTFWRNGNSVRFRRSFVDDILRQQAVRWVRNAPAEQPLFAWVAPVAPHVCAFRRSQCFAPAVFRPDRGTRACRGIPDLRPPSYTIVTNPLEARPMPRWPRGWQLRRVCQSLRVVDRMVGQLVTVLADRERPAILVFTSDNGMSWGQHGFTFKQTPPATRVPFYVAGTGIEPAVVDALVSKIDIAPTLADMAGVAFSDADGVSFLPILRGRPFFGRPEHLEVMPRGVASGYPGWDALRTPRWRFIRWQTGRRELYDLAADPWELDNLVRKEAPLARMLEARLDELVDASGGIPPTVPDLPSVGPTDRCGELTSRRPPHC
jgi:arylsulfatase A-like enzyme